MIFNQITLNVQLMQYVSLHTPFQRQEGLLHIQNMSSDSHVKCISFSYRQFEILNVKRKGKGKAVPLQAWSGPECSRHLRFPDFMAMAQDCGKVVSFTHRPPLPLGNVPGTHFC